MNLIQIIIDHYGEQFLVNGMIISSIIGLIFGLVTNKYLFEPEEEEKDTDILDS